PPEPSISSSSSIAFFLVSASPPVPPPPSVWSSSASATVVRRGSPSFRISSRLQSPDAAAPLRSLPPSSPPPSLSSSPSPLSNASQRRFATAAVAGRDKVLKTVLPIFLRPDPTRFQLTRAVS
uniref:Uncharacterized protein n=2 Tax=Cucumis melo TaxID=3656 RepID=A0A9I9E385_CUCME